MFYTTSLFSEQFLTSSNHIVKCISLSLLGDLMVVNNSNGDGVKFICCYTKSQDPRVRTAAYNAMVFCFWLWRMAKHLLLFLLQLRLHERGQKLELSIYSDVCCALQDDHENVRQCALRMVWVLSHSYAERYE